KNKVAVNPQAQYRLAMKYLHGKGVPQDPRQAINWLNKAAKNGYQEAQYQLGLFYKTGQWVTPDQDLALSWLRKAAIQNHAKAQYQLALSYQQGQGVTINETMAAIWLRKAASRGYVKAIQAYLGLSRRVLLILMSGSMIIGALSFLALRREKQADDEQYSSDGGGNAGGRFKNDRRGQGIGRVTGGRIGG
ncbi:MAG: tetratricopeptide repeat protein, partial [Pseudomonadota bacterium]|nr:tetratricopeptide repeat protein [Pseudomonadota bacterium]